jgi:hypothetical protein
MMSEEYNSLDWLDAVLQVILYQCACGWCDYKGNADIRTLHEEGGVEEVLVECPRCGAVLDVYYE